MAYRTSTLDTYLLDAAMLTDEHGDKLYIKPNRNVTVAEMQAALDAQYGKGSYKASSHGSARYVEHGRRAKWWGWNGEAEVNPCEEYIDGSRVHPKESK